MGVFLRDVIHHKIYACMHAYMSQLVTAKDGEAVLYCGFILFVCTPLYSFMAMGCNKKCSTHERRDLEGFVFLSGDMESDGSSDENGERVSGGGGRLEEEEEEEERKMLKRRISCHPLYGFLVEAHLDCLKVSLSLSLTVCVCVCMPVCLRNHILGLLAEAHLDCLKVFLFLPPSACRNHLLDKGTCTTLSLSLYMPVCLRN